MEMSNYRLRKITSGAYAEELWGEIMRGICRYSLKSFPVRILADGILEILAPLREDPKLGGPACTIFKFIDLRIIELNNKIAALQTECEEEELIQKSVVMKRYWEFIRLVMSWHDYYENKSEHRPESEMDWDLVGDLAQGESEEQIFYSGMLVLILTTQKCLKIWARKGELVDHVIDFNKL
jgi:hypothetical protein